MRRLTLQRRKGRGCVPSALRNCGILRLCNLPAACVGSRRIARRVAGMLSFQLPLELMLLANLALSLNLVLPLPLCKPGIALCRFSTTPVGQGITAAAFSILLLLLIQPLYDINNLHKQKIAAAETITHKDRRSVEASAHLAAFLTACNIALPVINRTLGLVKGQLDELRKKYKTKSV